jgi:hypothetical protein
LAHAIGGRRERNDGRARHQQLLELCPESRRTLAEKRPQRPFFAVVFSGVAVSEVKYST